ncbi:hypothetical protein [Polaribacter sp.]|uniref:hypothetical protein n=1 Tax=Polaribacter sp. TaxID=1920175 RepID=UPI003EF5511B
MVKKLLLLICLFFLNITCFSQNNKPLYGIIKDSLGVIINTHIVNLNSKLGTISSINGTFKISATAGDTLLISNVKYLEKKYIVKKTSFSFSDLIIYLQPKTYKLDAFELKRNYLTGHLDVDLHSTPNKNTKLINGVSLGLPNAGLKKMKKVDRKIYAITSTNIDLLLVVLSGRLKKLNVEKKVIQEDTEVQLMYDKLKYYLNKNFNIKKEDTFRFLYFCRQDTLFKKKYVKNEFELIKFLQLKSKEFNSI